MEILARGTPVDDAGIAIETGRVRIEGAELTYKTFVPISREAGARTPPFLLVLPILAGGEPITERVCRSLARRGIASGSLERRWKLFRERETIEELSAKLARTVRAQRAFLDWMAQRGDVDESRLGVFGLSMGGMLATMLAAAEPRVQCAVICLAGGDFARLALEADEIQVQRWVEERCIADDLTPGELREEVRARFDSDPLAFAGSVDARRVLFVDARFDRVLPKRSRVALWRALGRPERVDIPLGHYSSILALEWIVARGTRFATRTFESPPCADPVAVARYCGAAGSPAPSAASE